MGNWGTDEMARDIFGEGQEQVSKEQIHEMKIGLLEKYADKMSKCDAFYMAGSIPSKKIDNAIAAFAQGLDRKTILGFYDATSFGSGKEGMIFTDDAIHYCCIGKTGKWVYSDIESVDGSAYLAFNMKDGRRISEHGYGSDLSTDAMSGFLNELLELERKLGRGRQRKIKTKSEWLQRHGTQLISGGSFYAQGAIPDKKLNAAISKYAYGVAKKDVIALVDTTVFGSGKEGYLFTEDAVYQNQESDFPHKLRYEDIAEVISNGSRMKVKFKNGTETEEINHFWLQTDLFASFLKQATGWED